MGSRLLQLPTRLTSKHCFVTVLYFFLQLKATLILFFKGYHLQVKHHSAIQLPLQKLKFIILHTPSVPNEQKTPTTEPKPSTNTRFTLLCYPGAEWPAGVSGKFLDQYPFLAWVFAQIDHYLANNGGFKEKNCPVWGLRGKTMASVLEMPVPISGPSLPLVST